MYVSDKMTIKWYDSENNRYCLLIQQDNMADDPRSEDDGRISVMACWHRHYSLGDNIDKADPEEFWQDFVRKNIPESEINEAAIAGNIPFISVTPNEDDPTLYDLLWKDGRLEDEGLQKGDLADCIIEELSIGECQTLLHPYAEWLPLWLYDHSGITMSCGKRTYPYSDPWDSGQVGYIIVLKDKMISEYGLDPNDDESWRDNAVKMMEAEVKVYDQYLTNDVYWFQLHKFVDDGTEDGTWDEVDSCSGFYGSELTENGMLDHVGCDLSAAIESNQYETGTAERHLVEYWEF